MSITKIIVLIFISFVPPIVINGLAILGLAIRDEYNRPPKRIKEVRKGDGVVGDSWLLVTIGLLVVLACLVEKGYVHFVDRIKGLETFTSDSILLLMIALIYFFLWCWSVVWISLARTPNWQPKGFRPIPRKTVLNTLGVIGLGTFIGLSIGGMVP